MKNMKLLTLILTTVVALSGCLSINSGGSPGPQGPKGDSGNTTVVVPAK
ncbi:MAG: hypothetical protein ABI270_05460 [Nitrosospira sp.]